MSNSIIKIIPIEGNTQRLDGGSMFGNAPKAIWSRWVDDIDDQNRIKLNCRSMLVQYNNKNILVETGIGNFFDPKLKERYGVIENENMLIENLKKYGLSDHEVDYVFLTHLHFDHAGGLIKNVTKDKIELFFPNAKYIVSSSHWERARNPHPRDKASFIPGLCEALESTKRLIKVNSTETLRNISDDFTHVEVFFSEGHTVGLMLPTFHGSKESITFLGDLIPGSPWVHLPICMGYDRYPEALIEEKKEFYKKINLDDHWLFFTHDEKIPFSKIYLDEKNKYQIVQSKFLDQLEI